MVRVCLIVLALCALSTFPKVSGAVEVRTVERGAIRVDGRLDDEAWSEAQVIRDFVGMTPTEGFTPAGTTEVRIAQDERGLYFGWKCRFDTKQRVRANVGEREDVNRDDQVGVYLDPFGDGRRAFVFYINALGVQQDFLITDDGYWNPHWDAIIDTAARLVDGGYDLEMFITFRSLRFAQDSQNPWRVFLTRKFAARDEKVSFPARERATKTLLQNFVELQGVSPTHGGIGLEFLPALVLGTGQVRDPAGRLVGQPARFGETFDPSLGIKWLATPSLILDATINPDFSQVEADPDQVNTNLRYALFIDETRPFFLEGRELYDGSLLYTRSVNDPLYGLKFSGKQRGTSIGLLHALDERPTSTFVREGETPGFGDADVDGAKSLVTHIELGQDIGARSTFGLAMSGKELFDANGSRGGYIGSLVRGRWALGNLSHVSTAFAGSTVRDRAGNHLEGIRGQVVGYHETEHAGVEAGLGVTTPGYRAENAFMRRADQLSFYVGGRRRFEPNRRVLQVVTVGGWFDRAYEGFQNTQGLTPLSTSVGTWTSMRLGYQTTVEGNLALDEERYLGQTYRTPVGSFSLVNRSLDAVQLRIRGQVNQAVRYQEQDQALHGQVGGSILLRLFRHVSLELSETYDVLGRRQEGQERLWLQRGRLVVGFTRWLSLRTLVQHRAWRATATDGGRSGTDTVLMSFLLQVLPYPGTGVFVSYAEERGWPFAIPEGQSSVNHGVMNRSIFVKVSGQLRL